MDRDCPLPPTQSRGAPFNQSPALNHITMILKEQRSDIDEVLETIYDNINQQRSDLHTCIPELRRVLYGLLTEHLDSIKQLAAKQGDHGQNYDSMIRVLQQEGDDLVDSVNAAIHLANTVLMDTYDGEGYSSEDVTNQSAELLQPEEDWTEDDRADLHLNSSLFLPKPSNRISLSTTVHRNE